METKKFIVRCKGAGVFFTEIKERRGDEADLENSRRLFYWDGAASLSQLALEGVTNPEGCKFTVTVPSMTVLGIIEIIPCSEEAIKSINTVREWKR